MNFTNGKTTAIVYIDDKKVFLDGILYEIGEVKAHNTNFSRFSFGEVYNGKIINGLFSYTNTTTGVLSTLQQNMRHSGGILDEVWTSYIVYEGLTIAINGSKSLLKVGDEIFNIKISEARGISQVFISDAGNLSLSSDETKRPSMWNNIVVNLKV